MRFKDLYEATLPIDKDSGRPRGFLNIRKCKVGPDGSTCGDHGRAQDRLDGETT